MKFLCAECGKVFETDTIDEGVVICPYCNTYLEIEEDDEEDDFN